VAAHVTKTAALRALFEGKLSVRGEARLRRHLDGCAACRAELGAMRVVAYLAEMRRAEPLREPRWDLMEPALTQAAREAAAAARAEAARDAMAASRDAASGHRACVPTVAPPEPTTAAAPPQTAPAAPLRVIGRPANEGSRDGRGAVASLAGLFAAAAAALVGVAVAERVDRAFDAPNTRPAPAPLVADRPRALLPVVLPTDGALRPGVVTALAGRPTVDGRVTEVDAEIGEGARIETDGMARVDVRLADGTGFTVGRETVVVATRLRERATVLDLDGGEVGQQVASLGRDERWHVVAGPYVVRVRGTQFVVGRRGDDVWVTVREGLVEVLRDGEVVATVGPGERWSTGNGPPGASTGPPVGLEPGALRWPVLRLPASAHVAAWEFPFAVFPASGVAMRSAPGTLEAVAWRTDGRAVRLTLTLDDLGLAPESERALRDLVASRAAPIEATRAPSLDAASVRRVVAAGMEGLARCYRTGLMRRPDLEGLMTLHLSVDARGRVSRARLAMGETPLPWLAECVEAQAQRWTFPAPSPSGNVSLSVPLDFAQR
jgi:hypothetical protein